MQLVLRDREPEVVLALNDAFGPLEGVSVGVGDLLQADIDALVVPLQSVDMLDGGLVESCRARFGVRPWARIQTIIERKYEGTIPVGEALIVGTGRLGIRYLIAAPARHSPRWSGGARAHVRARMFWPQLSLDSGRPVEPQDLPTLRRAVGLEQGGDEGPAERHDVEEGARRALLAALRVAQRQPEIRRLGCPGLGTGGGRGNPWNAARGMRRAWLEWTAAPAASTSR